MTTRRQGAPFTNGKKVNLTKISLIANTIRRSLLRQKKISRLIECGIHAIAGRCCVCPVGWGAEIRIYTMSNTKGLPTSIQSKERPVGNRQGSSVGLDTNLRHNKWTWFGSAYLKRVGHFFGVLVHGVTEPGLHQKNVLEADRATESFDGHGFPFFSFPFLLQI